MQISDIKVRKLIGEEKLKAVVSLTFDDEFVVHDIKIISGDDRLFIAMPSRRMADGSFRDIAHPINVIMRQRIETAIIKAYEDAMNETQNEYMPQ